MNDDLYFLDEDENLEETSELIKWKILVVDDEEEVHSMTKILLRDLKFEGRDIEMFSAFNEKDAEEILQKNHDIALILLDVVMENDHSGLNLVKTIRDNMNNHLIRIVLRTGQPGQAPEREVIDTYDINDYKEKTELTAQKLHSTIITSLRSYKNVSIIDRNKKGLEKIIKTSSYLLQSHSILDFLKEVLFLLEDFIHSYYYERATINGFTISKIDNEFIDLAVLNETNVNLEDIEIYNKHKSVIDSLFLNRKFFVKTNDYLSFYFHSGKRETLFFFPGFFDLNSVEIELLKIFITNLQMAFHNIVLNQLIMEEQNNQIIMQKKLLFRLNEVIGLRSKETGDHVERVGEFAVLIGKGYGLKPKDLEMLHIAAPLHDVGKVGISDSILLKPAKLTFEEFEIIKKHTSIGEELLKDDDSQLLIIASKIAGEHHEKWNGKGYPRGLKSSQISIFGRIVSICDVFDALISKRVYKEAWTLEDAIEEIKKEAGISFDPHLVEIFLSNKEKIVEIINTIKGDEL